MSYTPTTWANGDIITATKLNNIESGVQSVSSSYTPTTWVNGDIITATKLNNIEQGIANAGGGGSSDFSTASVTLINNANYSISIHCPAKSDAEGYVTAEAYIYADENTSATCSAILYKGKAVANIDNPDWAVSVSGDAEYFSEYQYIDITGDCTITIS